MIKTDTAKTEKLDKKFLDACLACNIEQISQSLASGANINAQCIDGINGAMYVSLAYVSEEARLKCLDIIVNNAEFDINHKTKKGDNILMAVSLNPSIKILELLIKKLSKNIINETNNEGDNALQSLIKHKLNYCRPLRANDKEIIEKLIEIGVSIENKNKQNKSYRDLKKELDNLEIYNSK